MRLCDQKNKKDEDGKEAVIFILDCKCNHVDIRIHYLSV